MQLTEEQQDKVREWAAEGAALGEIQKRIEDEFGIRMTYMDARFLISDLEVSLKDKERPEDKKDEVTTTPGGPMEDDYADDMDGGMGADDPFPAAGGGGSVSVSIDEIAIPNSMVSGKVTFSDGNTASWLVDNMGRLSLDPDKPDYRPTEEDIMTFQQELQRAVSGM